jgi:hypothetical protein
MLSLPLSIPFSKSPIFHWEPKYYHTPLHPKKLQNFMEKHFRYVHLFVEHLANFLLFMKRDKYIFISTLGRWALLLTVKKNAMNERATAVITTWKVISLS